jgi:hypothetical protein
MDPIVGDALAGAELVGKISPYLRTGATASGACNMQFFILFFALL